MKKFLSIVIVLCVTLGLTVTGSAHYVDQKDYGISFYLSDDWVSKYVEDAIAFHHKATLDEKIIIEKYDVDWAWDIGLSDEVKLKELCDGIYSNESLSAELSEENNVYVRVKTDSVVTNYENYNNIVYYRYEKAYTASAYGFYDTPFYNSIFVTAKNGKIYLISYQRNTRSNHFSDIVDMLNSLSYDNGEIKIEIDGERIYPDSAPMIIEGRTLVPIRAVAEKMGYSVEWDGESQLVTLTASKGTPVLIFEIGADIALKNFSETIQLDVPAIILNGRTYLPLRAVAESMDADVNWNGAVRTVEITQ